MTDCPSNILRPNKRSPNDHPLDFILSFFLLNLPTSVRAGYDLRVDVAPNWLSILLGSKRLSSHLFNKPTTQNTRRHICLNSKRSRRA
jgi:hypothetical protein